MVQRILRTMPRRCSHIRHVFLLSWTADVDSCKTNMLVQQRHHPRFCDWALQEELGRCFQSWHHGYGNGHRMLRLCRVCTVCGRTETAKKSTWQKRRRAKRVEKPTVHKLPSAIQFQCTALFRHSNTRKGVCKEKQITSQLVLCKRYASTSWRL